MQVRTRELPPGDPGAVAGFLAMPDTDEVCPGVVVVHEIFGLNDNMRDIARRFAEAGYAALAVDLRTRGGRPAAWRLPSPRSSQQVDAAPESCVVP